MKLFKGLVFWTILFIPFAFGIFFLFKKQDIYGSVFFATNSFINGYLISYFFSNEKILGKKILASIIYLIIGITVGGIGAYLVSRYNSSYYVIYRGFIWGISGAFGFYIAYGKNKKPLFSDKLEIEKLEKSADSESI